MMTGHLIHIGYPKTGSNFLRRWFASHPQMAFVEGGIAGFKDVYAIPRDAAEQNPEVLYRVTSSEALATPHKDVGRPMEEVDRRRGFPGHSAQAAACSTLAALFPTARVLLVTRGFRSMLMSSYSQAARAGGVVPFDWWCAGIERGARRGELPWTYDRIIDLYEQAFVKLIVMPYELLRDDATQFTTHIERTLGLASHTIPSWRVNPSLSAEEMVWYPRLSRVVRSVPVGTRIRRRLLRRYLQATMTNRLRLPIRILNRVAPVRPISSSDIPSSVISKLARGAERLRTMPLYAPYRSDYLE